MTIENAEKVRKLLEERDKYMRIIDNFYPDIKIYAHFSNMNRPDMSVELPKYLRADIMDYVKDKVKAIDEEIGEL